MPQSQVFPRNFESARGGSTPPGAIKKIAAQKQVQRWLGHHAASFTLDTYIGLLNEELPEPTFFDEEPRVPGTGEIGDDQVPATVTIAAAR